MAETGTISKKGKQELLWRYLHAMASLAVFDPKFEGPAVRAQLEEQLEELRSQILERMGPDDPPKTEDAVFGQLAPGEEFLVADGSRNRAVSGGGQHAALPLNGPSKDILWWPGAEFEVKRIVG